MSVQDENKGWRRWRTSTTEDTEIADADAPDVDSAGVESSGSASSASPGSSASGDTPALVEPAEPLSDAVMPTPTEDSPRPTHVSTDRPVPVDDRPDPPEGGASVPDTPEELARRPLPRIIAIANQKGGVGKTTTTINLGAALADDGHRVLVVDLDPQGNATTGLGLNPRALEHSIYNVLLTDVPLEDCVEPTSVLNLFIAPASLDLAGAEIELVPAFSRESRLKNALAEVIEDYDYVLIDCPPSLGLLTVNALAAAHEVMVPIQCEYYALEGLGQLIRNVELVQKNLNRELVVGSIVLVMYDGRTNLAEQVSNEVREHFGPLVCRNVIPRNVRLSEAPSYGQPITTFDPSSRGAVAYRELAREVHSVSS